MRLPRSQRAPSCRCIDSRRWSNWQPFLCALSISKNNRSKNATNSSWHYYLLARLAFLLGARTFQDYLQFGLDNLLSVVLPRAKTHGKAGIGGEKREWNECTGLRSAWFSLLHWCYIACIGCQVCRSEHKSISHLVTIHSTNFPPTSSVKACTRM